MQNTTELMPLILAGEGYQLTIAPEANKRKVELLNKSASIIAVGDNDESAQAQFYIRRLAEMRIEIDKCRKTIKEPVIRIGKMIDQASADFLIEITAEEGRIRQLVGRHAEEVLRIKAEKEAAERAAFEASRAAREASEEGGIAAMLAAKRATAEKMEASNEVATTKVADGVRFAWDFEVTDIDLLAQRQRACVEITPRRKEIKTMIDLWSERLTDDKLVDTFEDLGVRLFKKPIISTR